MAEEFQESEVMFQENVENDENEGNDFQGRHLNSRELRNNSKAKRKKLKSKKNTSSSLPVNIPDGNHWFQYVESDFFDEEYGEEGEIVPPHVIIGRRIAGKMMSFSVCTGNGRTLKGRDLSQVRNSILRMTGFLET